ncbi:MAG TPA: thioredoxin family protein [Nocardioidaceae bacterium]
MIIKILGPCDDNCARIERTVRDVLARLSVTAQVERVDDPREIVRLGVRVTPALLLDDRVAVAGRVPTAAEVQSLLAALPAA